MKELKITDSHLGRFITHSGMVVNLKEPTPEMVDIKDIAISLSNIVRFNGHIDPAYTVAHHSIIMSHIVPLHLSMHALFHDAAEAYLGDVISPLKHILGDCFTNLEAKWMSAIRQKFGLETTPEIEAEIKKYDRLMLEHENRSMRTDLEGTWYVFEDPETNYVWEMPRRLYGMLSSFHLPSTYSCFLDRHHEIKNRRSF